MSITQLVFVAPYRIPDLCVSLKFNQYVKGVTRTIIVSPVDSRKIDWYLLRHGIDIANIEYISDRELIDHYPSINSWVFPDDTRNNWLKQQAIKLAALDYIDYEVALIQDPDTWLIQDYCPWDGSTINFMVLENTTESSYDSVLPSVLGIERQTTHCFVTEYMPVVKQDWITLRNLIETKHSADFLNAIIDAVPANHQGVKWFSEYEFLGNWSMTQRNSTFQYQVRNGFTSVDQLESIDPLATAICDHSPGHDLSLKFSDWFTGEIPNYKKCMEYLQPWAAADCTPNVESKYTTGHIDVRYLRTVMTLNETIDSANNKMTQARMDLMRVNWATQHILKQGLSSVCVPVKLDHFTADMDYVLLAAELAGIKSVDITLDRNVVADYYIEGQVADELINKYLSKQPADFKFTREWCLTPIDWTALHTWEQPKEVKTRIYFDDLFYCDRKNNYSEFLLNAVLLNGFDMPEPRYAAFGIPYDHEHGWPLEFQPIDFKKNTLLLLNFQDFITKKDDVILELQKVEDYYKDKSNQVLVTHWPHSLGKFYHGPINLIEFNSHDYQVINNLRNRAEEWVPAFNFNHTHAWQCLNGTWRPHRQRVIEVLSNWPNGVLSNGTERPLDLYSYGNYYRTENEDNFIYIKDLYSSCAVNIVTETQYDWAPGIVSEKTFMALLAKQIPIVVGYAGIVEDCINMGFDMFTDLVDTSYDKMPNDIRAEQALLLNRDLILGNIDLTPYRARLEKQHDFILNQYTYYQELNFILQLGSLAKKML